MNNVKELKDKVLDQVSGGVGKVVDPEIQNKVISIISKQQGIPVSIITLESKLVTDYGIQSLDAIDLIQTLSEEFKITIDETRFFSFVTVKDVVQYISDNSNQ